MPSNEANDQRPEPSGEQRGAVEDALSRLEQRLDRASEAAERLLADAAERVAAGRGAAGAAGAGGARAGADPGGEAVEAGAAGADAGPGGEAMEAGAAGAGAEPGGEAAEAGAAGADADPGGGATEAGAAGAGAEPGGEAAGGERRKPPPAGWQQAASPGSDSPESLLGADGELLLGLLGALRDRIPPELQQRLAEAVREVLLALRALIDWYLERAERHRGGPADVQDIPIL